MKTKGLKKEIQQSVSDYRFGCHMEGEKPTIWGYIRWGYLDPIKFHILWTICQKYGHKYVNTGGYATGDSGGDYFTCKRCGYSFTHIYY